ncbi:MAG: PRC-barrel domain-containing protein [Alphaproteobacteria bacterium]
MKHIFATTSVIALLLAGPALAQDSTANQGNNNSGSSATTANTGGGSGGPQITVTQPPPVVTVQPRAPDVTVTPGKPDVTVQQAEPKVQVTNPKPNVAVDTGKPEVKVLPGGKPDVNVTQPAANTGSSTNATTQQNGDTTAGSGSTTPPASGPTAVTPAGNLLTAANARNLIGKNVYGANGNQVGEVNNLLVGKDDKVHAAIIEFGGFLGIGEDKVAVPWDQLSVSNDRVTVNMSEDQIKAAPRWDQNRPGQFAEYQPLNK